MVGIVKGKVILADKKNYTDKMGLAKEYFYCLITDEDGFTDNEKVFSIRLIEPANNRMNELSKLQGKEISFLGNWTSYQGKRNFTAKDFKVENPA